MTEPSQPQSDLWELWYRDRFDHDCPPSIDVSGAMLSIGLAELWARHLFETVLRSGGAGFSSFTLRWRDRSLAVDGSAVGALQLRQWLFGEKEQSWSGYVAEAEPILLAAFVATHARLIDRPAITEQILLLAEQFPERASFLQELHRLPGR